MVNKMFSKLTLVLFCCLQAQLAYGIQINSVSNIELKKIYIGLSSEKQRLPVLKEMDLITGKTKNIKLVKDFKNKDLLGLYTYKDNLFVVAQEMRAEGFKPSLLIYNKKLKKWKNSGQFDCKSFDTLIFQKGKASIECEEINWGKEGGYKTSIKTLSIKEDVEKVKMILPLVKVEGEILRVELLGTPTMSSGIKIQSLKGKSWRTLKEYKASSI